MTEPDRSPVRSALRAALTRALKQRDRSAVAVYRAALAAIDNAEAVPVGAAPRAGALETSAYGAGTAEAPRRALTEPDMVGIVEGDARERCTAAEMLDGARPEQAARLRHEAELLRALIRSLDQDASAD